MVATFICQYLFNKYYLFNCISSTLLARYQILGETQLLRDNKAARKMVYSTIHLFLDHAEVFPLLNISTLRGHASLCITQHENSTQQSTQYTFFLWKKGLPPPWAHAMRCSLCQCQREGSPALSCSCFCQGYCPQPTVIIVTHTKKKVDPVNAFRKQYSKRRSLGKRLLFEVENITIITVNMELIFASLCLEKPCSHFEGALTDMFFTACAVQC